jgi:Glycosyltransferase family 17
MITWDVFLFGDEIEMLECRLMEAENQKVRHVLIEAPYTHRGEPKPLYYAENKSRFAHWADRITHVIADIPGPGDIDPWIREHAQREHAWAGLNDAEPDDIVLMCDVDEIPAPIAYQLQGIRYMHAMSMRQSMFAVDWVLPRETRIAVAGPRSAMHVPAWQARDNSMRSVLPELSHMGWHFTWLGGPEAIRRKAGQFCHLELRDMIIKANEAGLLYEGGMTWYGEAAEYEVYPPSAPRNSMIPAVVDQAWPRYIRERLCPDNWFRPVEEAS